MSGATDDGGEDGSGSVITGETGLAHAGAVIDDQSGGILVTHDEVVGGFSVFSKKKMRRELVGVGDGSEAKRRRRGYL